MKKILSIALVVVLLAGMAVTGTMAYLQDSDSDVNVMTLGNVEIDQIEQEWKEDESALQDFTQAKPLYPYVGTLGWENTGDGGAYRRFTMENVVDKIVSVKNVGKSDAYVRTVFAFEMGEYQDINEWHYKVIGTSHNSENGTEFPGLDWVWSEFDVIKIDGHNYAVRTATYADALPAGESTIPSLLQVYMNKECGNKEVAAVDGNDNGTYDILVVSQAVQTAGFENAAEALEAAFPKGDNNANVPVWFTGEDGEVEFPAIFDWEGVNYITTGDTVKVSSGVGDTVYRGILSDGKSSVTNVVIGEGITRLNDRALCKAPTITSVTLPSSLTFIDQSVFQQSGITSIEIPENVTYVGKMALGACDNLETIVIKAEDVTIADYAARDCANLKAVYIHSDSVTFEPGSMYFTNKQTGDASGITFYVPSQEIANTLYNALSTSHSYGLLIKSLDGGTVYYS